MNEARVPTPADMQRDKVRGVLLKGMELLDAKGHDYAGDDLAFINFSLVGMILDWAVSRGVTGEDLAFVSDIARKFSRLIELRGSNKIPKNETIENTCMDLANYAALWGGWILTKDRKPVWPVECFDGVTRTKEEYVKWMKLLHAPGDWLDAIPKKEYEKWAEGEEGEYPDLDLEAAKVNIREIDKGHVNVHEEATGFEPAPKVVRIHGVPYLIDDLIRQAR